MDELTKRQRAVDAARGRWSDLQMHGHHLESPVVLEAWRQLEEAKASLQLARRVHEALEAAADNCYFFEGRSNEEVAIDMVTYCPDMEREDVSNIALAIGTIRSKKPV